MVHVDATEHIQFERVEYRHWLEMLWRPVLIAAAIVTVLLLVIVATSHPAWSLLGIRRGLVPEELYPISGFAMSLLSHSVMQSDEQSAATLFSIS